MTREARDLRDAFRKEARRATDAIDSVLAAPTPPAVSEQRSSGERGAVMRIARDLADVAGTMQVKIEGALRGRGVREARS